MLRSSARVLGSLLFLSATAASSGSMAGSTQAVVSIADVTWSLASPGGVGTFRVAVNSTAPIRANAVWAQAISPGTTTIQAAVVATPKAASGGAVNLAPTANGRCYTVKLQIEPDSAAYATLEPKLSSRTVCLDPDGTGILYQK